MDELVSWWFPCGVVVVSVEGVVVDPRVVGRWLGGGSSGGQFLVKATMR